MKKAIAMFCIAILGFCTASAQDEGNWEIYMAMYEKGVGSTIVNMEAKANAPIAGLPFLVITGVTFAGCDTTGMPVKEQFDALYSISDSVAALIEKDTKANIVGTFTYQCERLDYHYVADTIDIRNKLTALYKRSFPSYSSYIKIVEDKEWDAYLNFLYPNEEIKKYIGNQKVVLSLKQAGDELVKERKVDHWLYFNSEKDRNCMIAFVKSKNFWVEKMDKSGNSKMAFSLQISRTDKVDLLSINVVTNELRKQAKSCGGEYDG